MITVVKKVTHDFLTLKWDTAVVLSAAFSFLHPSSMVEDVYLQLIVFSHSTTQYNKLLGILFRVPVFVILFLLWCFFIFFLLLATLWSCMIMFQWFLFIIVLRCKLAFFIDFFLLLCWVLYVCVFFKFIRVFCVVYCSSLLLYKHVIMVIASLILFFEC